jgi:hypothetical protein
VAVNVDAGGQFLALVQNEAGARRPISTSTSKPRPRTPAPPPIAAMVTVSRSVKTAPGRYLLDVAPKTASCA